MRYPPLLIALFLMMLLRPFYEHFRAFPLPGGTLPLLVVVTLIYAFRHQSGLAVFLTVSGVGVTGLRFADDYWQIVNILFAAYALSFVVGQCSDNCDSDGGAESSKRLTIW